MPQANDPVTSRMLNTVMAHSPYVPRTGPKKISDEVSALCANSTDFCGPVPAMAIHDTNT